MASLVSTNVAVTIVGCVGAAGDEVSLRLPREAREVRLLERLGAFPKGATISFHSRPHASCRVTPVRKVRRRSSRVMPHTWSLGPTLIIAISPTIFTQPEPVMEARQPKSSP